MFPVAWVFGRMGCSSVHDHPGALAVKGAFLAVEYPRGFPADASPEYVAKMFQGPRSSFGFIELLHGDLPRYDLGLLEMLFTVCLASLLALTWHKKVRVGTYVVATAVTYGPVRFMMDYLRITDGVNADPRYGGLTPAQWCCLALTLFGLAMIGVMLRNRARGFDPGKLVLAGSLSGEEVIARKKYESTEPTKPAEVEEEDDDEDEEKAEEEKKPSNFPGWKALYEKGDIEKLPWFSEALDKDLVGALDRLEITKGRFLDLGTGPGTQAIALAKRGLDVVGSDLSPAAIDFAKKRAKKEEASKVEFVVDDVLDSKLQEKGPFDAIFDRGCFHVLPEDERGGYVATVKGLLGDGGRLFLKTFSDEQPGAEGPHRFTEKELRDAFEGDFEIETLEKSVFEGQMKPEPKALFAVMKKK